MSYDYKTERAWIFTEEGSTAYIQVLDNARNLLREAGAFMCLKPLNNVRVADTWRMLALIDRLVETGVVQEVTPEGVAMQSRVFVAG